MQNVGYDTSINKKKHPIVKFLVYDGDLIRVVTSLRNITAEEIADMYKIR